MEWKDGGVEWQTVRVWTCGVVGVRGVEDGVGVEWWALEVYRCTCVHGRCGVVTCVNGGMVEVEKWSGGEGVRMYGVVSWRNGGWNGTVEWKRDM